MTQLYDQTVVHVRATLLTLICSPQCYRNHRDIAKLFRNYKEKFHQRSNV